MTDTCLHMHMSAHISMHRRDQRHATEVLNAELSQRAEIGQMLAERAEQGAELRRLHIDMESTLQEELLQTQEALKRAEAELERRSLIPGAPLASSDDSKLRTLLTQALRALEESEARAHRCAAELETVRSERDTAAHHHADLERAAAAATEGVTQARLRAAEADAMAAERAEAELGARRRAAMADERAQRIEAELADARGEAERQRQTALMSQHRGDNLQSQLAAAHATEARLTAELGAADARSIAEAERCAFTERKAAADADAVAARHAERCAAVERKAAADADGAAARHAELARETEALGSQLVETKGEMGRLQCRLDAMASERTELELAMTVVEKEREELVRALAVVKKERDDAAVVHANERATATEAHEAAHRVEEQRVAERSAWAEEHSAAAEAKAEVERLLDTERRRAASISDNADAAAVAHSAAAAATNERAAATVRDLAECQGSLSACRAELTHAIGRAEHAERAMAEVSAKHARAFERLQADYRDAEQRAAAASRAAEASHDEQRRLAETEAGARAHIEILVAKLDAAEQTVLNESMRLASERQRATVLDERAKQLGDDAAELKLFQQSSVHADGERRGACADLKAPKSA